ncbi:MAG: acyl carrier protein [Aerococcus sp.]|nr:acyl carrier protein [Aerococcus sp.]
MSEESVYCTITEIITERYGIELKKITPDMQLKEQLGADSLDIIEFVMLLEDRFKVIISDQSVKSIATVQDLVTCVIDSINATSLSPQAPDQNEQRSSKAG